MILLACVMLVGCGFGLLWAVMELEMQGHGKPWGED